MDAQISAALRNKIMPLHLPKHNYYNLHKQSSQILMHGFTEVWENINQLCI